MKTRTHAVAFLTGLTFAVVLMPAATLWADLPKDAVPPSTTVQRVTATMMGMPLQFEANHGQVDAHVTFLARGHGYTLFLTSTESVMVLQQWGTTPEHEALTGTNPTALPKQAPITQAVVRMKLEGANPSPTIDGMEPLPGIVNYFIGNDPAKWHTTIPTYAKVQYQDAYPGITLAYYGNQGRLEYDFLVAPGADPNQIKLAFEGASDITVADSGDLVLTTALGDVRMQKPVVYQLEPDGHKTLVAGQYTVASTSVSLQASRTTRYSVGFRLASYDHAKPVVIDPVLLYSTYLGGSGDDRRGYAIAVDAAGSAYVTGQTQSTNFPTANPFQATDGGAADVFVTKLSAAGSHLLYSTYLGGSNDDLGYGIAVDAAGSAYVTGNTQSTNFPTVNPLQATNGGNYDAFVTKFSAAGSSLLYSTYLGGSDYDQSQGIAVDAAGNAYVTGYTGSTNFPTANPLQATNAGGFDVFVMKLTTNVPFAAFRANVEIELRHQSHDEDVEARHRPHEDAFEMTAIFTLGPNNNGIAPLTEAVTVQVGTFSTTIPAGSFTQKKGRFTFEGVINGVRLEAVLRSLVLGNDYEFKVEGKGADLTGTVNPVTVGLTIGDDSGSTAIRAKH